MADNVPLNPNIAAAPVYRAGTRIEDIQAEYGLDDVIKLASNENALGPSPRAIEAIQQAAPSLGRYPPMGDEALRTGLARAIGQGMTAANFVTGHGGSDVLFMVAHSFLQPDDEVIICRPTFPVYEISTRRVGARPVWVDLDPDRFTYDVAAILAAVTARTRLIYICNPNNPSGTTLAAGPFAELVNNVPDQTLIVSDECYRHFVTGDDFPDTLEYVRAGRNVMVVHSFSKAYGLAGLRLGYGITRPDLAEYLWRARMPFHLSSLQIAGGQAALLDTDHLARSVELTVEGRAYLYEQLCELDLPAWPSQANFVLFKPSHPAQEIYERLLRRGVIVRPVPQFYLPEHMRVTVGLPEENRRFIAALREVLAELAGADAAPPAADVQGSKKGKAEFKF